MTREGTLTQQSPGALVPVVTPGAPPLAPPTVGAILRRVGTTLLVACVMPVSLFYGVFSLAGFELAMAAALGWAYGALAWRHLTGRRTSGLLVLTAIILTGRTVVALVADSAFLYFLQPIISDSVVGLAFLLSLVSARPMVARLAGDFYPMDHEVSLRPRVRRLFHWLTVSWAALCLGKSVGMFWVLNASSLDTYVLVQSISAPTLNVLAAGLTIACAVVVARAEGLMPCAASRRTALSVAR